MPYADKIDEREGLQEWSGFLGLRNNVDPESFGREDLVTALNVDISDDLGIGRRKGYSAILTANVDRDLWASGSVCLGVGSNALKMVNPDYSLITLRSGLTASRPLSYAAVGDRVFWSNGAEMGCVQDGTNRTWGIAPPTTFSVTAGPGALAAGKYQVAITYLRGDLQESGAARATTVELTSVGGISLSSVLASTDTAVTHKVIYCTSVGGETLFRVGVIANSVTTFSITEVQKGVSPLLTQFLQPPPPGDHIAYQNGYMLVAVGARLYPSEAYAPELFDWRKAVPFLDPITMIAPVKGGVWLGLNNQIVWVAGDTPEAWDYKPAADYGVIPHTLWFADTGVLGDGKATGKMAAFFASKQGLCAGLPGGELRNLTETRYAYPSMDRGAGIVRRHRGIIQYIVSLQGTEVAANVAA
ncbi:MAG: hypothetical protein NUV51_11075 [Sulfuricaulis sp.]|nr:hypothetical protein [Sulfuricaulis sp.]